MHRQMFVLYGGQAVSGEFPVKMKAMAPRIGTGLGLMEEAGFCTYANVDADELAKRIGFDSSGARGIGGRATGQAMVMPCADDLFS